jgi:hypothetical protein
LIKDSLLCVLRASAVRNSEFLFTAKNAKAQRKATCRFSLRQS